MSELSRTKKLGLDPWVLGAAGLVVGMLVIPAIPVIPAVARAYLNGFLSVALLLTLTVVATARASILSTRAGGRSFWFWATIGQLAWLIGDLLEGVGVIQTDTAAGGFLMDLLFFVFYLGWILALDRRPDLIDDLSLNVKARRLASMGRVLFLIGLFTYFVLLPRTMFPETYLSFVPSFSFYVVLDLYLTWRLVYAAWEAQSRHWRVSLGFLSASMFFLLLADSLDLTWLAGRFQVVSPSPVDIIYYLPMLLLVVASRAALVVDDEPSSLQTTTEPDRVRGVPLVVYSLVFPILHIFIGLRESVPLELEDARGVLVITWLVLLGGLNLLQNTVLQRTARNQRERRKEAEAHVRFLSRHDALTGLLNRRELDREFEAARARSERTGAFAGVLFIDLDRFKTVNDTYGHQAGDAALRSVAERLRTCIREVDNLYRYGGDEFVLVFEALARREDAAAVIQRIVEGFDRPILFEDKSFNMSASIGLAVWPDDGATLQDLLKVADRAMYSAKGAANGAGRSA